MSIFEHLKKTTLATVSNVMGTVAKWYPGGDLNAIPIAAKVFFNDYTDKEILGGVKYEPNSARVEYFKTDWIGLKEDVKNKRGGHKIEINGVVYVPHAYISPESTAKDGDMYVLLLNKPLS